MSLELKNMLHIRNTESLQTPEGLLNGQDHISQKMFQDLDLFKFCSGTQCARVDFVLHSTDSSPREGKSSSMATFLDSIIVTLPFMDLVLAEYS